MRNYASPRNGSSKERPNPLKGASLMNSPLSNERYPQKHEIQDVIERCLKERENFGSITYKVDKDKAKASCVQPEPRVFPLSLKEDYQLQSNANYKDMIKLRKRQGELSPDTKRKGFFT